MFVYLAASVAASAIHDLTSGVFNSFVEGHELSLVACNMASSLEHDAIANTFSFPTVIAPWCIHCQDLQPEFESVAARVLGQGWPLARVD